MKTLSILGVTGTIGQAACDVVRLHSDTYNVQAVSAHTDVQGLAEAAKSLHAARAVIADDTLYVSLKDALSGTDIEAAAGEGALLEAASIPADCILNGIVGMAGLGVTLAAARQGNVVAIANKEPLVAAGPIIMQAAAESGVTLLPVDSEHNAVFQCFDSAQRDAIERIILTASGGPFLRHTPQQMQTVTKAQALQHPNWAMGPKITIDSATMMNKGLEIIEACQLFDMPLEKVEVIVHPQSIVHAMVEYNDGSILSHLGAPDMRTPITHAMAWPTRMKTPGETLKNIPGELTFEAPNLEQFPALDVARQAYQAGLYARIALNAANEVAVAAFLNDTIHFTDIIPLLTKAVDDANKQEINTLEDVNAYDKTVRQQTKSYILKQAA